MKVWIYVIIQNYSYSDEIGTYNEFGEFKTCTKTLQSAIRSNVTMSEPEDLRYIVVGTKKKSHTIVLHRVKHSDCVTDQCLYKGTWI